MTASAEKTCFKCLCKKPLEAFYKHSRMADGRLNKCIECAKADIRRNRTEKIEYYRQYDKLRASQPHRIAQNMRVNKEYRQINPKRRKANGAVSRAVREGKLMKLACQVCGDPKSVGHHPDYDNPLGVVWLCQVHHKEVHALATELEEAA